MFKASQRVVVAMLGMVFIAASAFGASTTFSQAGANAAAIQASVDSFRTALGTNNGVGSTFASGRREINWDGVPDTFASPDKFKDDFFNTNSPRGAVFNRLGAGIGFFVSAKLVNPKNAPVRFGDINPNYTNTFTTFSAERLFTINNESIMETAFFVPGTTSPATVAGFGAVFSDVDRGTSTSIEYFDSNGVSLGKFAVAPGVLSFLGVLFDAATPVFKVKITAGSRSLAFGVDDDVANDLVVMDDFIYAEPQIVTAPLITSPIQASVTVNAPFVYQITATGTRPFIFFASLPADPLGTALKGNLPPNLFFDAASGTITGNPTDIGSYIIIISAANVLGTDIKNLILSVEAIPPGPGSKSNTDSDGDGFPDELENAENTTVFKFESFSNPLSSASTPYSSDGVAVPGVKNAGTVFPLTAISADVRMFFGLAQRDSLIVRATLPIPIETLEFEAAIPADPKKLFVVDFGGVIQSFPIPLPLKDAKANPKTVFENRLRRKDRKLKINGSSFEATFLKSNLAIYLNDEGLINENVTNRSVVVPVIVLHKNAYFRGDVTLTYNAVGRGIRKGKGFAK